MKLSLPPASLCPSLVHVSPFPETDLKSSLWFSFMPSEVHFSITAFARGCSLMHSRSIAACSRSLSVNGAQGMMSVTVGLPLVMVPVLSSTTICVREMASRACDVLKRIPFRAAFPLPTMIATGVASPRAHGHEITSTQIPRESAKPMSFPRRSQTAHVTAAIAITAGTKIPLTLSAIRAMGAFVADVSLTIWMIFESVVSSPTLRALHRRNPDVFTVA